VINLPSSYFDYAFITSGAAGPSSPRVTTDAVSGVSEDTATLNGSLDDLGSDTSVDVYFKWTEPELSSRRETNKQTLSSTGPFSQLLDGELRAGVTHTYKAVGENSNGTYEADDVTFTTDSITVIEDFEDGGLVNWREVEDSSQATTAAAFEGTYGAELDIPNASSQSPDLESSPGDGLPYYPVKGDVVRIKMRLRTSPDPPNTSADLDMDSSFMRGNGQKVNVYIQNDDPNNESPYLLLAYTDDNGNTFSDTSTKTLSLNTFYTFELDTSGSTIDAQVVGRSESASISETPTGGSDYRTIRLRSSNGSTSWGDMYGDFDYITLE